MGRLHNLPILDAGFGGKIFLSVEKDRRRGLSLWNESHSCVGSARVGRERGAIVHRGEPENAESAEEFVFSEWLRDEVSLSPNFRNALT
jgi:hypothetical protein